MCKWLHEEDDDSDSVRRVGETFELDLPVEGLQIMNWSFRQASSLREIEREFAARRRTTQMEPMLRLHQSGQGACWPSCTLNYCTSIVVPSGRPEIMVSRYKLSSCEGTCLINEERKSSRSHVADEAHASQGTRSVYQIS